jgi:hypothetical protein
VWNLIARFCFLAVTFHPGVSTVLRKYNRAVEGSKESEVYLRELTKSIDATTRAQWDEQMSDAQAGRATCIDAMDVFDTAFEKGILFPSSWDSLMTFQTARSIMCPKAIGTHKG